MTTLDAAASHERGAPAPQGTALPHRPDAAGDLDPGPERAIEVVVELIAAGYPEVEPSEVRHLLLRAHARFEGAPVQAFRLVLSEREVRRELRSRRLATRDTTGRERADRSDHR